MKTLGKIAVIGDKDSVLAFKAIGVDIFPFTHPSKVKDVIKNLIAENYAIILIFEDIAEEIENYIEKTRMQPYPIILPLPNGFENTGYGMNHVYKNIESALGAANLNKDGK